MRVTAIVAGGVLALSLGVLAQDSSLADLVRRHGPIELAMINDGYRVDLSYLVVESHLIARGRVVTLTSFESRPRGRPTIMTDYAIDLLDIFHQRLASPRQAGDQVAVRRDGGELLVEGHLMKAYVMNFPAFEVGEEYVLALRADSRTGTFSVVADGQGAFLIGADWVARQVRHIPGETPEETQRLDLRVDDLRSLIVSLAEQPPVAQ
jgi:hypothetical protein